MNIAIFHYQVGGTDGVSLEIEKWKLILEGMGHTVHLVAGDLGSAQGKQIREMYHHLLASERLYRNTFLVLEDKSGYLSELQRKTKELSNLFGSFLQKNKIDLLVAENVWSVAVNPAVAPALEIARQELNLPAVAHHHDFYWERPEGFSLTCAEAAALADKYLPPRSPNIKHTVINSLAQQELLERKGIHSLVVPNVFDFSGPAWKKDEYNRDLRREVGISENDLVLLQATRIIPRKGIELAIDFAHALGEPRRRQQLEKYSLASGRSFGPDSRIVLVLAGYARDDATGTYKDRLAEKARSVGVHLHFIESRVDSRRIESQGHNIYSLWDTYSAADLVTYPSLWEGWGNQFLEAIKARLPIVVFEYPVFKSDIKNKGFKMISLGDQILGQDQQGLVRIDPQIIEGAADLAVEALTDANLYQNIVEHNFSTALKHFSLEALRKYLEQVFNLD